MTQTRHQPAQRPGASRLTILHVLPWLNFGGGEIYVLKLSRGLQARGHRVLTASNGGLLEPQFAEAGITHLRVPINDLHFLPALIRLCRIVAREQVDLICAHNWTAGAVANLVARRTGAAYCFTVHGSRSPFQRHFVFYWGKKVIAVSRESREQLVRDFRLDASRVVESMIGVDTQRFRPAPPPPALLAELGLDAQAPTVVHVCRFSRSKAPVALALIQGAPALDRRHPGAQVVLVGGGPLAGRVQAEADRMNRQLGRKALVFAGGRSDVADLLNAGDVAVGTATVALEAMACGKPLVAAGKAGFIGAVTPDNLQQAEAVCFGDHGQLQPTTPEALIASVADLLDAPDRRRQLGDAGRRAVAQRYSLERMAQSVGDVYRAILADPAQVRQIVVIAPDRADAAPACLPALEALRRRFPSASITGVAHPGLMDLLRDSPGLDNLVALGRDRGAGGGQPLLSVLRARRPDLAVSFSPSRRSTWLAYRLGAKERIGFADAGLPWLLTRRVRARDRPAADRMMRLVACLGAAPEDSLQPVGSTPEPA